MIEDIKLISAEEINEKGVCAAPTVLTGTPEENKRIFDRLCTEVIIPRLNDLISEGTALEKTACENSDGLYEVKKNVEGIIESLGEITEIEISGDTLAQKITEFRDSFVQTTIDIVKQIGPLENLDFFAVSVVGALNYLHEMISPGAVNFASALPAASFEEFMKIYRIFDVEEKKHKLYICKARFPDDTGISVGDVHSRIYFDPYSTKERYAAFRQAAFDRFKYDTNNVHYINLITFASTADESQKAYLQIRYSLSLDGYVLAFYKDGGYTDIWASDNFKMDNAFHFSGYYSDPFTDFCSGYKVEEIEEDLSWLLNANEFQSEFYWEEVGASAISANVTKIGRYSTFTINNNGKTQSVVIEDGISGYTPIKGQDYFTQNDIDEISASIESALKEEIKASLNVSPEFAENIDGCTDKTKLYVLPDGYIYAFQSGSTVEKVNFAKGSLVDNSVTEYGYVVNHAGCVTTDYIDVDWKDGYKINIYADELYSGTHTGKAISIAGYVEEDMIINVLSFDTSDLVLKDGAYRISLEYGAFAQIPAFLRITVCIKDDVLSNTEDCYKNLFIELEEKNIVKTVENWFSTGVEFVSSEKIDKINALTEIAETNSESIELINQQMGELEKYAVSYPSVWDGEIAETISMIKSKQSEYGINGVTFAFFSDNHQRLGFIGAIIAKLVDECNIPYVFFGGDSIDDGVMLSSEAMEEKEALFKDVIKFIPKERFCRALGHNDGSYVNTTGNKYEYTWEEKYSLFIAPMAVYQNKVFGGDGTYYYVDDVSSSTRFIVLNSVWFFHETNSDGTVNNSDGYGFGNEQINWLSNVLKNTPKNYAVAFVAHSPITNEGHSNLRDAFLVQGIINAYVNGESYSGEYMDGSEGNNASVSVSFAEKGKVIGWFSGHIHKDTVASSDSISGDKLSFKTVTITSDANISYDENEAERNMDGDTGHAVDFITVNKKTGEVYLARLGIGNDRTYNYLEE